MEYLVWILAGVAILIGVLGTVIPAVPGTPLIFAGALLIGWWHNYSTIGVGALTLLGVLAALGVLVDFIASSLGAKRVGASSWALLGATLGSFLGLFFSIPGIIIGPFLGGYLGELFAGTSLRQATKVGVGTWVGLLLGTVFKVAIALSMVGFLAISLFV
jgi:uncharacterized protein YqgC (DUF456 family)